MSTIIYNEKFVVYKVTNILTGKSYIGKTVNGLEKRWKSHISDAIKNKTDFHSAIRKYLR